MRYAAKRDGPEEAIAAALTADGNPNWPVSDEGHPDRLVWCWRLQRFRLLEVKAKGGKLRPKQVRFFQTFGAAVELGDVVIVRTVAEALAAVALPHTDR